RSGEGPDKDTPVTDAVRHTCFKRREAIDAAEARLPECFVDLVNRVALFLDDGVPPPPKAVRSLLVAVRRRGDERPITFDRSALQFKPDDLRASAMGCSRINSAREAEATLPLVFHPLPQIQLIRLFKIHVEEKRSTGAKRQAHAAKRRAEVVIGQQMIQRIERG